MQWLAQAQDRAILLQVSALFEPVSHARTLFVWQSRGFPHVPADTILGGIMSFSNVASHVARHWI